MKRNRFAAFAAGTMITVASLGLVAAPAQADTRSSGCTVVKPAGPRFDGYDSSNRPMVKYVVDVWCSKGRSIQIHQQGWEEDGPNGRGDDYIGARYWTQSFPSSGSIRLTYRIQLPQTWDSGGGKENNEELYQKVRFRVTEGLTTSGWTPFERGGASWIFH